MIMPSARLIDPHLLYLIALIWNLVTIGYIILRSIRSSRAADPLSASNRRARTILESIRPEQPAVRAGIDRDILEKIPAFARNPHAFGYTLDGAKELLDSVKKHLSQESVSNTSATAEATGTPNVADGIKAAIGALRTEGGAAAVTGTRALAILVGVDCVILVLMAANYFAR
jgi:hypothetical protein